MHRCHIVPPYLIDKLAEATGRPELRDGLDLDERLRASRHAPGSPAAKRASGHVWEVHTADHTTTLPGTLVRADGQPASGDDAVDEAATGVIETLALYRALGRDSYDDHGADVVTTVHYGQDYDNAFWDGTQLVVGDGDGTVFLRFTKPIDVLGHELSHAVTQYTANLTYQGQSGALNESVSDVFGICVKHRHRHQDATSGDWLIGEGIFAPGIQGRALRDMAAPGTAYDDPKLGKDPQVGSMADYDQTSDDNGGVHINSGIPNLAFVNAARAIGGDTLEGAGRIWYAALTSGLGADTDFAGFAAACVAAAGPHADAVRTAWADVGVTATAGKPAPGGASAGAASATVQVTRRGGFAGLERTGTLDLEADDDRAREARELVDGLDLAAVRGGSPAPDRFVYEFRRGDDVATVHESALTPDLARLAALAIEE